MCSSFRLSGPVFIKHVKSNVYVTLNAIGSFLCNLCFHWLIKFYYLSFFMNTGPEQQHKASNAASMDNGYIVFVLVFINKNKNK